MFVENFVFLENWMFDENFVFLKNWMFDENFVCFFLKFLNVWYFFLGFVDSSFVRGLLESRRLLHIGLIRGTGSSARVESPSTSIKR